MTYRQALHTSVHAGCLQMPERFAGVLSFLVLGEQWCGRTNELPSLLCVSCCLPIATGSAANSATMCNTAPLALRLQCLRGERETERMGDLDTLRAGDPFPLRAGLTDLEGDLEADLL